MTAVSLDVLLHKSVLSILELKPEYQGTHVSSLNLDINKVDGKFFFVVRIPHIDINISNNIFYSAFLGETLRLACSTLYFSDFFPKIRKLLLRTLRQGGKVGKCYSSLKRVITKHQEDFSKFNKNSNHIIRKILSKIWWWFYVYLFQLALKFCLFCSLTGRLEIAISSRWKLTRPPIILVTLIIYSTNFIDEKRNKKVVCSVHCVKSVRIRSFCGPYSARMRQNTDQKNSDTRIRTLLTLW